MKDPYRYFRVEARQLVDGLSEDVLLLEREPDHEGEITARLLRAAHTLKGAARVVGQAEIAAEAHALEDALTARAGVEELLAHVDAIEAGVAAIERPAPAAAQARHEEAEPPARVDLDELDRLLEAHQDARTAVGSLRRALKKLPGGERRALDALATTIDAALGRIAVHAHELRLVPASSVFAQLSRAARDAAAALGKEVVFEARGGESSLDGRVLTPLRDALLHLVRNAVDHGIEDPAARLAAGKPEAGHVILDVQRRGNRVSFVCRDDGRGIDLDALRRSAERHAVAPTGDAARLVFEPGVSTREQVTAFSGRGVGLDAVREIVTRLGGEVGVHSDPGKGAAFTLMVPVSLSSMSILGVEAGALRAAVPLDAVRRTLHLEAPMIATASDREVIVDEGRALPFLRLAEWADAVPENDADLAPRSAVIVEAAGGAAALGVSRLLGVAHTVVHPIPGLAGSLPALGASLDADGVPEPVLDPAALVAAAAVTRARARAAAARRRRVLVVDDSVTSRMLEQSILEAAGFEVGVACSGDEGLRKALDERFDLFVVDVEMPRMNGFEFVSRVQATPGLSSIPAIIVSARGDDADKRRGAAAGARAWVVKGQFAQESFLELVRGLTR